MKRLKYVFVLLAFALMGYSSALHADDTDIYVSNATNNGVPNVLFVFDNSASFDSDASTCTYPDGTAPSMNGKSGGIEQCALVAALTALPDSAVNIGIMAFNANNFATDVRSTSDAAYHEVCPSGGGGCLLRKLTLMNSANKTSLMNFVKSWQRSGQSSASQFVIKINGTATGASMQEAWAYLNGKVGMSGKDYGTSIIGSGCQKNFVIFIANAFGSANTSGDSPLSGPLDAMKAAQVGSTTAQQTQITDTVSFSPATCKQTTPMLGGNVNWADEWARLMYQQDGGTSTMQGTQNITTYTIGVVNDATCKPDYPQLLSLMAKYGGGKYFKTGNATEVATALETILNEVQAVNSVFSSASLPVSVNADGSYLNQIYLGMFRPDATANPRWLGNLKQYHLIKNSSGVLVQGDAQVPPQPAINPTTGFISPTAVSFWTKKDTASLPDSSGGFWINATTSQGVLQSAYDSPDGEVVEKGGVSQKIRMESLTADFTTTAQSTTNPRRMYTYCPSATSCAADLTDSTNLFSTANSGIASSAFGASTTLPVTSIVRTGTSALVTTSGNHGLSTNATVTISGASQPEYNVTQAITVNSGATFTITGLPDYPTTSSTGTYTVALAAATPISITSMARSTTGTNSETVTATTSAAHGFTTSSNITVTGASPSDYNFVGVPSSVGTTTFTFPVTITPTTPAVNSYVVQLSPTANPSISNVSLTNPSAGAISGTTSSNHNFHVGESIIVSNPSDGNGSKYPGTFTITAVTNTTFSANNGPSNLSGKNGITATVTPNAATKAISALTRTATTTATTATATGLPSGWFGANTNDTKVVNITKSAGSSGNESAYVASGVTITCLNTGCTSFSYPITVSPASAISLSSATVGLTSASSVSLTAAGAITRNGTTATVTGIPAGTFTSGQTVTIAASGGTALASESAYLGNWQITCASTCTSFTFGPVTLSPATPATGNIKVYSGSTPPDRDTMIRWVRGQDNFGDEQGPGGTVTVRPSVHGDVLHSRPLVINYGDSRGIVVFYGSNDGIYRAVNGNQTTGNVGGVVPGGELWGLVLPEHYGLYNRLRQNTPEIKFPSTLLPSAQAKDYFVDGQTASYQLTGSDGKISTAYIFLTMRRGGRFMYALDVTQPATPKVLWKKSSADTGFTEMGQTWSRPRVTIVQGGGLGTTPLLVFGAGYDPAQDSEPPVANTVGRGIFILKATDGSLVWSANSTCTSSATCRNVPGMNFAIPSDIAFVDRDGDGYTDKLYFGDTGGNVWRADISNADTSNWTVTKLASLGCDDGAVPAPACSNGKAPRKFFFPPAVLSVKGAGESGAFDAISIPSGDREHPLKSTATGASYGVNDKFFVINDLGTSVGTPVTSNVNYTDLFNATSTQYDGSLKGFFINFATGEKGVNAPLATNGQVFFATNRPVDPSGSCSANLGEAKAYAVSPFLGTATTNLIVGGGLPPSPVAGLITVTTTNADNTTTTSEEKFCIGCAAACTSCSALENSPPVNSIPKNLRRTYWYKK